MTTHIQAEEATNEEPLCPHCEEELSRVLLKRINSMLGVRYLYFCPNCHKALGISHRKGFWMG